MDDREELERLKELNGYGVLDSPNEADFDAIVRQAAGLLDTPIALISFIDEDRQWNKAKIGLESNQVPRTISFCTHAIRSNDVFVVQDAQQDPRFAGNPMVTGDPNIRFYAGAPLRTGSGRRIGTLCVIDRTARPSLTSEQNETLTALAAKTMDALEQRRARREGARGRPHTTPA